jgi:hypothetical protein
VLAAAGTGASIVLRADERHLTLLSACGFAVALLVVALALGSTSLLPWPIAVLGGAYVLSLADGPVDQWAPVYAGALLAVAELAYWSLELRGRAADVEQLTERRAGLIVGLAIGATAVAGLVLAATALSVGSGLAVDLAGVVAAVAAAFVIAAAAARH